MRPISGADPARPPPRNYCVCRHGHGRRRQIDYREESRKESRRWCAWPRPHRLRRQGQCFWKQQITTKQGKTRKAHCRLKPRQQMAKKAGLTASIGRAFSCCVCHGMRRRPNIVPMFIGMTVISVSIRRAASVATRRHARPPPDSW